MPETKQDENTIEIPPEQEAGRANYPMLLLPNTCHRTLTDLKVECRSVCPADPTGKLRVDREARRFLVYQRAPGNERTIDKGDRQRSSHLLQTSATYQ